MLDELAGDDDRGAVSLVVEWGSFWPSQNVGDAFTRMRSSPLAAGGRGTIGSRTTSERIALRIATLGSVTRRLGASEMPSAT